jgi:hypothetical protein
MKVKIEIINHLNKNKFGGVFENQELADQYLAANEAFGKQERWMKEEDMSQLEKQRVLHSRTLEDGSKEYRVKRDYDILVTPVTSYKEDRQREYPDMNEVIEAMIENLEGRPQKLNTIKEQRAYVRKKYPKLANGETERR